MENHVVVRTGHLNHKGSLFGGQLLLWVDEAAYIAAMKDFPRNSFVTRAFADVQFKSPVQNGSILRFACNNVKVGESSVVYEVKVFEHPPGEEVINLVFETNVAFVAVDNQGNKAKLITKQTDEGIAT